MVLSAVESGREKYETASRQHLGPIRQLVNIKEGLDYLPDNFLLKARWYVSLHPFEASVLEVLLFFPNQAVSLREIRDRVSGSQNQTRIAISRIRTAFVQSGVAGNEIIESVPALNPRGRDYRLNAPRMIPPNIHPSPKLIAPGYVYDFQDRSIVDTTDKYVVQLPPRPGLLLEKLFQFPNTVFSTKFLTAFYFNLSRIPEEPFPIWEAIYKLKKLLPDRLKPRLLTPGLSRETGGYIWING